ncbi:MAG TPA: flagellar biosynthetic protein FliO [Bryobacteraceae bacterium]|nr:flagellar biosynthetic protein FliO [Bryobacteraceae bacterium]
MGEFDILRQLGAVLFVFALLGAAVWLFARRRDGRPLGPALLRRTNGTIAVLERVRLTPQHSIHLLRVGRRGLLVSVHPAGCTLLETRPIEDFTGESIQ